MKWSRAALMGLIVGEGSFTTHGRNTAGRPVPVLVVRLHEDDPEPLLALHAAFGGRLYGPYQRMGKDGTLRRFRSWHLVGHAVLNGHVATFERGLPPSKKREQFHVWMREHGFDGVQAELPFHVEHSRKPDRKREVTANSKNRGSLLRLPGT